MANKILVTKREYTNIFRAETTTWPLWNTGDIITLDLDLEAEIKSESEQTNPYKIPASVDRIVRTSGSFFDDGFASGMSVSIAYTAAGTPKTITGTIGTLLADTMFLTGLSGALDAGDYPYNDSVTTNSTIVVTSTSSINGIEMEYAHILNSDVSANSTVSQIDGTNPKWTLNGIDATNTSWQDLNPVGFESGISMFTARIKGNGLSAGVQKFQIQLVFMATPIFETSNDFTTLTNKSFNNTECVTDFFKIDLLPQFSNPNIKISTENSDIQLLGNTGWFEENYNGGANSFSINSVTLTNSFGVPITGIDADGETNFTININHTGATSSSTYKLGFLHTPADTSLFSSLNTPFHENLLYNGLNDTTPLQSTTTGFTGTGYSNSAGAQMDIEFISLSIDSGITTIKGKFKPNTAFGTYMNAFSSADLSYLIWVSVGDETLVTSLSDRVSLIAQTSTFITSALSTEQFDVTNSFLNHAQPVTQVGSTNYEGCLEDEVIGRSIILVDTANNETIDEVKLTIEGFNVATGGFFELESTTYNTSQFPKDSAGVQQINVDTTRGFQMATGVDKDEVKILRSPVDDTGTKKAYRCYYAFRFRWEDWLANSNVDSALFDSNELNNNLNNDWATKDDFTNWKLRYNVNLVVNRNGTIINTKNSYDFSVRGYEESSIWDGAITTYDETKATNLYIGLDANNVRQNAILPSANTLIEADFDLENVLEDVGNVSKYYGVIRLEEYRNGGLFQIKMLSTVLTNVTSGNILIPLTGQTGPTITKVSTTKIRLECLIDFNDLNFNQSKYKISARLGCHELNAGKYNVQYSLKYN